MARALECPACGARHRLDTVPDTPTFRCDRCGQVLKVPEAVRDSSAAGEATAPVRGGSAAAPAAPAPPPRRRGGAAPTGPTVSATSSATATLPATAGAAAGTGVDAGEPPASRGRSARAAPERTKARLYWRIVAWVVAVPLGFVITAWPAFEFGLIEKDDVLDIFVGEGLSRYVRLVIGAAIWALVTALLVQLFVEGGRAFAARRKARHRQAAGASASTEQRRRPAPVKSG